MHRMQCATVVKSRPALFPSMRDGCHKKEERTRTIDFADYKKSRTQTKQMQANVNETLISKN